MEIITVILLVIIILLLIVLLTRKQHGGNIDLKKLEERIIRIEGQIDKLPKQVEEEFRDNRKELNENFQAVGKTLDARVKSLQDDNSKKLDAMRQTVDEKLQSSVEKRFNESFKRISTQLTEVYQGLGEMKSLASGVGDLKKVMEGVKTRGMYGEVQLGNIIADSLAKGQYYTNIATKKGSSDRVEFAVRMPGKDDSEVLLPIDSKFPIENYARLLDAYDKGNKSDIEKYQKELAVDVKTQAKKISTKYLDPPSTTDFGVMFLPTESLYAEILRIPGLFDEVRQKQSVTICSPSTLPVILSSLTMGFRTLAIEKRSSEVWATLGAVKTQFGKFGDLLAATKKKLQESANKIGDAEVASRNIERKLKDVETLPESESIKMIGEI